MSKFFPAPYEPFGGDINVTVDLSNYSTETHCMKIRIFVLQKFVKRTEKIRFSLVFICLSFTKISYFLNFPSNENVRMQHLSANAYCHKNKQFFTCV